MATYEFAVDTTDAEKSGLDIKQPEKHRNHSAEVTYLERAFGILTIADMTEIERLAAKYAMYDTEIKTGDVQSNRTRGLRLSLQNRVERLAEIDDGTSTTPTRLRRAGSVVFVKRNKLVGNAKLGEPQIRSFATNLEVVGNGMFAAARQELSKDGPTKEAQYREVAGVADRMSHEILDFVEPQLVAVHGLTLSMIQEALTNPRSDRA